MNLAISADPGLPCTPDPRGLGGLLALVDGAERPLPLRSVRVRATLVGDLARTVIEQRFENPYDQPLEVIHIFPLPENGAVVEVELMAGEISVRAEVRERKEAERAFEEARQAGYRAALLSAERDDVHTLRCTNLPPRTEARVRIVVEQPLEELDGELRWRFPTTIAPRYTPGSAVGHEGPGVSPDTDLVPDASRLCPPLRLSGGTRLDLEVEIVGPVRAVRSSLHAMSVELEDGGLRLAPSESATLDRDLVLFLRPRVDEPLRAWTDGPHTLLSVGAPAGIAAAVLPRDAVFVVDISGSMGGRKMEAAKLALKTALRGLMPGDRFRLLAFDTRVEEFGTGLVAYGDRSLAEAERWVAALHARGGTEMAPAMAKALEGATPEGRLRTVLFITDGESSDEARLLQIVQHRREGARIFPLGIDTAVNSALLEQVARLGGGVAELCTPRDDIEAVVARLEARFGSPVLSGLHASGGTAADAVAPVVFAGRSARLLLEGAPVDLEVSASSAGGPWTGKVHAKPAPFPLGPSWARARVAALQDRLAVKPFEEEAIRAEVIRVALAHGVASRWTSFVAVDRSVTVSGERVEVVQPVELPVDWDRGAVDGGVDLMMSAMPAPMAPSGMGRPTRASRRPGLASRMVAALGGAPEAEEVSWFGSGSAGAAPPPPSMDDSAVDAAEFARSAPAPRKRKEAQKVAAPAPAGLGDGEIARAQSADGSFGGDLARTVALLLVLVLHGHTRRAGLRTRTVQKAATWLAGRASEPLAREALELLDLAEAGQALPADRLDALERQLGIEAGPLALARRA